MIPYDIAISHRHYFTCTKLTTIMRKFIHLVFTTVLPSFWWSLGNELVI